KIIGLSLVKKPNRPSSECRRYLSTAIIKITGHYFRSFRRSLLINRVADPTNALSGCHNAINNVQCFLALLYPINGYSPLNFGT
ncbi:hypothetical protein KU735_22760, partial [Salmonella enterica subsp. enterica serovar Give]|nr:hypothetical protein [Salmonella enterica subsp. enterica serovar Give]